MKSARTLLLILVAAAVAVVAVDILYASRFVPRFKRIEKERIVTSNQLATAKIVSENLEHVRDLVFRNMDFPGEQDSVSQESILFDFLTACVNDLKMQLVSVRPLRPTTEGRVTTYGYDLVIEGDFFSLGELCAKLENSQRVLAVTALEVRPRTSEDGTLGPKVASTTGRSSVTIRMHLDTFRVKKG